VEGKVGRKGEEFAWEVCCSQFGDPNRKAGGEGVGARIGLGGETWVVQFHATPDAMRKLHGSNKA